MIKTIAYTYSLLFLFILPAYGQNNLYECNTGSIRIESDAPLELIEASTNELKGFIDIEKHTFAFQVRVNTLTGFNSPLQQEHFYENYMETDKYPFTQFSGKVIEKIDFSEEGTYTIRAKGNLEIHGVEVERIIKCTIKIKENQFSIESEFIVLIEDHNISIPKLVNLKIAEEIKVIVNAIFTPATVSDE